MHIIFTFRIEWGGRIFWVVERFIRDIFLYTGGVAKSDIKSWFFKGSVTLTFPVVLLLTNLKIFNSLFIKPCMFFFL